MVVVQGVYKLEPNFRKFYGPSGEVLPAILKSYRIPAHLSVLGYIKHRRTESHTLSLRDSTVALSLKNYLEQERARSYSYHLFQQPVLVALITTKTLDDMATHDYDYTFWAVGDDESSFVKVPFEVSNMIESPQEDYQAFQSNLAPAPTHKSHAGSIGLASTVRSVATKAVVDTHENMVLESMEATKKLIRNVLQSEAMLKQATEEVEKLKQQLEAGAMEKEMDPFGRPKQRRQDSSPLVGLGLSTTTLPQSSKTEIELL
ncbi:hypothetical protein BGW41_002111 [Actinomortierella wolfii]|nr:hypothetical protein BGW41_002111 [Actinomortierella wolfii]